MGIKNADADYLRYFAGRRGRTGKAAARGEIVSGLRRARAVFGVRMRHRTRPVGCFKRQTLENLQPRNRQLALLPSGQQMAAQSGTPRRETGGGCV